MTPERRVFNEKIDNISDLASLKRYACQRYKYQREWYMNCFECASRKTCKAGQRAIVIMDNETKAPEPEKKEVTPVENAEMKKRQDIIRIFEQEDPVKALLESSGNVKPQSVYLKINTLRKQFPDLEEKYHMLEKVRFLWRKPYDSMRVPDILAALYPNAGKEAEQKSEPVQPVPEPKPEPQKYKSGVTLMHEQQLSGKDTDGDEISLEDFLNEIDDTEEACEMSEAPKKEEKTMAKNGGDISETDALMEKLKAEKKNCEARIAEIEHQMEAVKTVQDLMRSMK